MRPQLALYIVPAPPPPSQQRSLSLQHPLLHIPQIACSQQALKRRSIGTGGLWWTGIIAVSEEAWFITCREKEQEQKPQAQVVAPGPHGPTTARGWASRDVGQQVQPAGMMWTVPGNQKWRVSFQSPVCTCPQYYTWPVESVVSPLLFPASLASFSAPFHMTSVLFYLSLSQFAFFLCNGLGLCFLSSPTPSSSPFIAPQTPFNPFPVPGL